MKRAGAQQSEAELRQELGRLNSSLEEADEALDEWIAEAERLQGLLKSREKEMQALGLQLEELRLHSIKVEEELDMLRKQANKNKQAAPPADKESASSDLARANEALRVQLVQSQEWVKEAIQKKEEAERLVNVERDKTKQVEKDLNELLQGKRATVEKERDDAVQNSARLTNVCHAYELQLNQLKEQIAELSERARDAEANSGRFQALKTATEFHLLQANTENDLVVSWMKSVLRWSSKL